MKTALSYTYFVREKGAQSEDDQQTECDLSPCLQPITELPPAARKNHFKFAKYWFDHLV